jgi:uncharacterized protein YndB with AHSA1/START domain
MMIASRLVTGAALAAILGAAAHPAAAEVVNVAANGFEVRETVHIAASSDKVYAALLMPAHWWNSEHTFSGNAANLSLDARAGGCWCESLPGGGSVEHLRVVYVSPGKVLRLRGALGPFQALPVDGVMTWSVKSAADGSDVSVSYAIGGYIKDGADDLSKAADRVLGEQMDRLKKSVEGPAGGGDAPRAH